MEEEYINLADNLDRLTKDEFAIRSIHLDKMVDLFIAKRLNRYEQGIREVYNFLLENGVSKDCYRTIYPIKDLNYWQQALMYEGSSNLYLILMRRAEDDLEIALFKDEWYREDLLTSFSYKTYESIYSSYLDEFKLVHLYFNRVDDSIFKYKEISAALDTLSYTIKYIKDYV